MFQFINRIELQGVVGKAATSNSNGKTVTRFVVMTQKAQKDASGAPCVTVQWFNCFYDHEGHPACPEITKGDKVRLEGSFEVVRTTDNAGLVPVYREIHQVMADKVTVLDEPKAKTSISVR